MPYVYHMVPGDMKGTILYPLNQLKNNYPELYEQYTKKYEGRTKLLDRRIERLDCLWNDVIHFSALNPKFIFEEIRKLGRDFKYSYFEIPAELLEPEKTVVYVYSPREKGTPPPESDYIAYEANDIEKYAYLPEATIKYYKETIEAGGNPMGFHLIPHILYKGMIDTSGLEIKTG